jgi:hypothetical protein
MSIVATFWELIRLISLHETASAEGVGALLAGDGLRSSPE